MNKIDKDDRSGLDNKKKLVEYEFDEEAGYIFVADGTTILPMHCFAETEARCIILPDTLKSMGKLCFGASRIERIAIPDSVTRIDYLCFAGTSNLESITLPKGIKEIPEFCFENSGIITVDVPEGVTKIDDGAFRNCTRLKRADLPMSLVELGSGVFHNCPISMIFIPPMIKTIVNMFYNDIDCIPISHTLFLPVYTEFITNKPFLKFGPIEKYIDPNKYSLIRYDPELDDSLEDAISDYSIYRKHNMH